MITQFLGSFHHQKRVLKNSPTSLEKKTKNTHEFFKMQVLNDTLIGPECKQSLPSFYSKQLGPKVSCNMKWIPLIDKLPASRITSNFNLYPSEEFGFHQPIHPRSLGKHKMIGRNQEIKLITFH